MQETIQPPRQESPDAECRRWMAVASRAATVRLKTDSDSSPRIGLQHSEVGVFPDHSPRAHVGERVSNRFRQRHQLYRKVTRRASLGRERPMRILLRGAVALVILLRPIGVGRSLARRSWRRPPSGATRTR